MQVCRRPKPRRDAPPSVVPVDRSTPRSFVLMGRSVQLALTPAPVAATTSAKLATKAATAKSTVMAGREPTRRPPAVTLKLLFASRYRSIETLDRIFDRFPTERCAGGLRPLPSTTSSCRLICPIDIGGPIEQAHLQGGLGDVALTKLAVVSFGCKSMESSMGEMGSTPDCFARCESCGTTFTAALQEDDTIRPIGLPPECTCGNADFRQVLTNSEA